MLKQIIIIIILFQILVASNTNMGTIITAKGNAYIIYPNKKIPQSFAIPGKVIKDGDIVRTLNNSYIEILTENEKVRLKLDSLTQLSFKQQKFAQIIELEYGKIFVESRTLKGIDSYIKTNNTDIKLNNSEIWLHSNYSRDDELFVIEGEVLVKNKNDREPMKLKTGEAILSSSDGRSEIFGINSSMLPDKINTRFILNKNAENSNNLELNELDIFSQDLIPMIPNYKKPVKKGRFNTSVQLGSLTIENSAYSSLTLNPQYISNNFKFEYQLDQYFASDSSLNLNNFDNIYNILSRINQIEYISNKETFHLNIGQLKNITFGYGSLLKKYTNSLGTPRFRDTGINLILQSKNKNYTLNFLGSSLRELSNSGGLVGLYSTAIISKNIPLKIGLGYVYDINQFSDVSDTVWSNILEPFTRSVSGFQINLSYEIYKSFSSGMHLFGEFSTLTYPDTLRFIRQEEISVFDNNTAEQGINRTGTYSITGPGLKVKLDHYRIFSIALNFSSALHIPNYFNQTYNFEKSRLYNFNLDEIESPLNTYNDWVAMLTNYSIKDDTSMLYLGKDMYALIDPTKNVYNKIGIITDYSYTFREYYQINLDAGYYKQLGDADFVESFYTFGLDLLVNDNVLKNISILKLSLNQYFTTKHLEYESDLDSSEITLYNENLVLGAKIGIKILKNVSLLLNVENLYYDNNFDGITDKNGTNGLEIKYDF